jgi:hypothetical protein
MDGEYDDFEEVFRLLAADLSHIIRRDAYQPDVERIRGLRTANQKLIFLLTVFFQPQHWSSYKRILGVSEKTLNEALGALEIGKYLQKDKNQFWWIKREETKKDDKETNS